MPETPTYFINFEPFRKRIEVPAGTSIQQAALLAGLDLISSCNGLGVCASCKVNCAQGSFSAPTPAEIHKLGQQLQRSNVRLACQTYPTSDATIIIPASSLPFGQQLQIEGITQAIPFSPAVCALELSLPGLHDEPDFWQAIQTACKDQHGLHLSADLPVLRSVCHNHQISGKTIQIVIKKRAKNQADLISVLPVKAHYYGLAVDAGSTKIACYWMDLTSGQMIEQSGLINPQIALGEDIVSRIAYANQGVSFQDELRAALSNALKAHMDDIFRKHTILQDQLVEMVVVGNTVIHHLFCGLPVHTLGEAPYLPVMKTSLFLSASEHGYPMAAGASIFLPPIMAGYMGADHVAAILASRMQQTRQTVCLVDIGTNTEVSLFHQGINYSCSCASGPAFEGAHIRDGMRAMPGAIDRIEINGEQIQVSTIANQPALGICGSGILSIVAEMQRHGVIDQRGAFSWQHGLLLGRKTGLRLCTAVSGEDIEVTRRDVHEIQLAKAAIRSGIEVLCQSAGIHPQQIDQFLIAGAMGTHLEIADAVQIGMFPDLPLDHFAQIGNAAGMGAREMLFNQDQRDVATEIARQAYHVELTTYPDFQDLYISALVLEKSEQLNPHL